MREPEQEDQAIETLLDWLKEMVGHYHLHDETYQTAEDFVDLFIKVAPPVPKHRLQLVGITCLLISSKASESFPPGVEELADVTDWNCSVEEIQQLEEVITRGFSSGQISIKDLSGLGWGPVLTPNPEGKQNT